MSASHKITFLDRLMRERDRFELLLNRAGFWRRMTMKGVAGTWSIKDILAQVWAYEQHMADRLDEVLNNQAYTPCKTQAAFDAFLEEHGYPDFGSPLLDIDKPSEWIVERYKNIALDEIVAQELQAFSSIINTLEGMTEEQMYRHDLFERVANHTYRHYREYAGYIKRWLKITAANRS